MEEWKRRFLFDVTKFLYQRKHGSGLNRVSARLQDELGALLGPERYHPVRWSWMVQGWVSLNTGEVIRRGNPGDVFFTPEIFAPRERLGIQRWIQRFRGKTVHLFHDAIPFQYPEITWPKSVRRFPRYLRFIPFFDQSVAVSEASAEALYEALAKLNLPARKSSILPLGADYGPEEIPQPGVRESGVPRLLMVGILEPRKQQDLVLDACEALWAGGGEFSLTLIGRVNPHFGGDIQERIVRLKKAGRSIEHWPDADDAALTKAYSEHDALIFVSRIEGFGLPVLEALWSGCPVVMEKSLPAYEVGCQAGGVMGVSPVSVDALQDCIGELVTNPEKLNKLKREIRREKLPRWKDAARVLAGPGGKRSVASSV